MSKLYPHQQHAADALQYTLLHQTQTIHRNYSPLARSWIYTAASCFGDDAFSFAYWYATEVSPEKSRTACSISANPTTRITIQRDEFVEAWINCDREAFEAHQARQFVEQQGGER